MLDISDNETQSSVADSLVILFSIYVMDLNILSFNLIDDQLTRAWDVNGEVCWLC
jgi:hypothetical protein